MTTPNTTTPNTSDIHSRAMLVRVSVKSWEARRFDRKVTDEVNATHGAAKEAGRFNKHLLGGRKAAPQHAAALSAAGAVRQELYAQTLPWADEGWRLLPTANFDTFTDAMRKRRGAFDTAVSEFVDAYPSLVEGARILLNGMFREGDYPAAHEVGARFSVEVEFSPVPAQGDLRVALPAETVADIERRTAERVERATQDAMQDAWSRLRDVVAKLRAKLAEKRDDGRPAIFRDSLIGNVRDVVDILARLNVTGDDGLEQVRAQVEAEFAGLSPESLRKSAPARDAAVNKADAILATMTELYGGAA